MSPGGLTPERGGGAVLAGCIFGKEPKETNGSNVQSTQNKEKKKKEKRNNQTNENIK